MEGSGYHEVAATWWPFLFILLAGFLPTDVWRWLGVLFAGRIDEHSPAIAFARAVATALVAAVIARLVLYPGGSLGTIPVAARVAALGIGFVAYLGFGQRILVGIVAAETVLVGAALTLA